MPRSHPRRIAGKAAQRIVPALVATGCVLGVVPASAIPSIVLSASASVAGDSCGVTIPAPPGFGTFYVLARDASQLTCGGMAGARFRIDGLPAGWVAIATPAPAADFVLGNPFDTGTSMAFANCVTQDLVVLYSVTIFPAAPGANAVLRVTSTSPPTPNFACPMLVWCDCPADPPFECSPGSTLVINPPDPCTVSTRVTGWSRVKGLYSARRTGE